MVQQFSKETIPFHDIFVYCFSATTYDDAVFRQVRRVQNGKLREAAFTSVKKSDNNGTNQLRLYTANRIYLQMYLRRRRRRRNDGILRLAVTDNINVLRDRLRQEIARRQQQAQQNMQNQLNDIGQLYLKNGCNNYVNLCSSIGLCIPGVFAHDG